jgi:hypothetical protein
MSIAMLERISGLASAEYNLAGTAETQALVRL